MCNISNTLGGIKRRISIFFTPNVCCMERFYSYQVLSANLNQRIMKRSALLFFLFTILAFSSIAQNEGDFKTINNGYWHDHNTWQKYVEGEWVHTDEIPSQSSNVYIFNPVVLFQEEGAVCHDLHVNVSTLMLLENFTIEVWGQLGYHSDVDFPIHNIMVPASASNLISSNEGGGVVFRGESREIIVPGSGGTANALSKLNITIDLDEGATATLADNFRIGALNVRSGNFTVNADSLLLGSKDNSSGKLFLGEHVEFNPPAKGIMRDVSQPILSFELDSLATLNISTSDLVIASQEVKLNGTVIIESSGVDIRMPSNGSIAGAASVGTYNDLTLMGEGNKILSGNTTINGTLTTNPDLFLNPSGYTLSYGPKGGVKFIDAEYVITDDFLLPAINGPEHLTIENTNVYLHESRSFSEGISLQGAILNLSDGVVLTLGPDALIEGDFSESNYIQLDEASSVRKVFDKPGSFYFPIGTGNLSTPEFTPADVSVYTGDFTSNSYLEVRVIAEKYSEDNSTIRLERHWAFNSTLGALTFDGTFKYLSDDPYGDEASIMAYLYGQSLEQPISLCDPASKTLSFSNLSTELEEFYITGSNKCNVTDNTIIVEDGDYCGTVDLGTIVGSVAQTGDHLNNEYSWYRRFNYGEWERIDGETDKDYDPAEITVPGYYEIRREVKTIMCDLPHMSNIFAFTLYPEVTNVGIEDPSLNEFCEVGVGFEIVGEEPTGGNGIFSFVWERKKNDGAYEVVGGDTKDYLELEELGPGTYSYRRGVESFMCGMVYSDAVAIEIYEGITNFNIVAEAQAGEYCGMPSEVVIKSVNDGPQGGDGTYAYVWERSTDQMNYQEVGTDEILLDTNIPDYGKYYYRRKVTSFTCEEKLSNVVLINIYPEIENNTIEKDEAIYCAESSPFTIEGSVISGGDGGVVAYRWERSTDGLNFTHLNSDTQDYVESELSPGDYYYRRIVRNGVCSDTSEVLMVQVLPPVANNEVIAPAISEYCGIPESIALAASEPEGGDGKFSYAWERSIDGGEFVDLGIDTKDLDDNNLTVPGEYEYRRIVISATCEPTLSNVVKVTLYPELSTNAIAGTGGYCNVGTDVILTGSTMSGGNGTYAYVWEREKNEEGFVEVGTGADYHESGPLAVGTYKYRRTVTSGICSSTSEVFTISVYPPIANNTIIEPEITNYCGTSDSFVIEGLVPEGGSGNFTYKYERKFNDGAWEEVGGNAASLEVTSLDEPGTYQFRRAVDSDACNENTSNVVTIQVSSPMEIVGTVTESRDHQKNGAIAIEVSGGIPPYSYLWSYQARETQNISGLDGGEYTVTVIDAVGCQASAKFDVPHILGLSESPNVDFYQLYPNPVRETLYIEANFRKSLASKIYIVNMLGEIVKTVHTTPANKLNLEVDMHAHPEGIYFIKVEIDGKVETWKFIKQ